MKIIDTKINGIKNPIGYKYEYLVCSWKAAETDSKKQTNALIEISKDKDFSNIIWQKQGEKLCQAGEEIDLDLTPRTRYYYRVTVTGDNNDSAVSETSYFETGKMNEKWNGNWITTSDEDKFHPIMQKKFIVDKQISYARLYVSGVGLFEAYINNEKLGNEFLTPYVNNYETAVQAITFEADSISQGENTLEFMLGKGWYMGNFGLEGNENNYGDKMALIAELHIHYADGTNEIICTDSSWNYKGSDIEDSGIYFGEICNHLLWDKNELKPVKVIEKPELNEGTKNLKNISDRLSIPVIIKEKIPVKQIITTPKGESVLDMGQNFAGFIEFKADFPKGTKIVFDFGEILQNGNFYRENYREAVSQYIYVSDGKSETVRPHFTFFGFRYVKVTGWAGEMRPEDFTGCVLYSDIERTGYINTSNEKINRLYQNTIWGLKSNFIDIPTDCPQRNERLGWTGDAQVFAPTASYHMDTRAFFHKFINDLRCEQKFLDGGIPNYIPNICHKDDVTSVWGDIATFLPDTMFKYFGSIQELKYAYPLMKDWVDYIEKKDEKNQYTVNFGFQFGDWLALDGPTPNSFKGSTDEEYIGCVYYYASAEKLKNAAEILGYKEDFEHYSKLAQNIRKHIIDEYFTPNGRLAMQTQASYVIAVNFDLYVDRDRLIKEFKEKLQKDGFEIKCGFVGAPLLCTALAKAGLYETAYDFLLKESFPSWLYSVNLGATTIWERWNSVLENGQMNPAGMNSLNHYAYGSVMEFVYGYAAGIRPLEAGFKKAVIAPKPDVRLPKIDCSYDSVYGKYSSAFEILSDGSIKINIEIPFNCEAEVHLPSYPHDDDIKILTAGKYEFKYMPETDYIRPYGEHSTLNRLSHSEKAMEILKKYTPALAGMALDPKAEFAFTPISFIRNLSFLPYEPEKLEIAIDEIKKIKVL